MFITTENHHAGETFMLDPTFFLGPAVPPVFYSRIATGGTVMKKISIFFDEKV